MLSRFHPTAVAAVALVLAFPATYHTAAGGSHRAAYVITAPKTLPPMRTDVEHQFSADIVVTPPNGPETQKVYVGRTKVRVQMLKAGQPEGGVIYDIVQNTMTFVSDKDRKYIDGNTPLLKALTAKTGIPPVWRLFHPTSPDSPCDEWNAVALTLARTDSTRQPPHFTCTSQGSDAMNGRQAHKWAVTSVEDGKTTLSYVWIDDRLHVVSKSQDAQSTMELKNVAEGPQPESIFQVPPTYEKIDLSSLLLRLRDTAGTADILGDLGKAAKNGAVEGAKEGTAEAAKEQAKKKIKSIFHVP